METNRAMTDINKQMGKKAHSWAMIGNNISDYNTLFYSFKKGYESALHDSRWRKVSEELPDVFGVGISKPVLVKKIDGSYDVAVLSQPHDAFFTKKSLITGVIEWKPID